MVNTSGPEASRGYARLLLALADNRD
jgi:hypothetical protein